MKIFRLTLLLLLVLGCKEGSDTAMVSDELEVYDYDGLAPLLNMTDDRPMWSTFGQPGVLHV